MKTEQNKTNLTKAAMIEKLLDWHDDLGDFTAKEDRYKYTCYYKTYSKKDLLALYLCLE